MYHKLWYAKVRYMYHLIHVSYTMILIWVIPVHVSLTVIYWHLIHVSYTMILIWVIPVSFTGIYWSVISVFLCVFCIWSIWEFTWSGFLWWGSSSRMSCEAPQVMCRVRLSSHVSCEALESCVVVSVLICQLIYMKGEHLTCRFHNSIQLFGSWCSSTFQQSLPVIWIKTPN